MLPRSDGGALWIGWWTIGVAHEPDRPRRYRQDMNKIIHLILAIVGWLFATHRLMVAIDAL